MTVAFGRFLVVALLSLASAACQSNGESVRSISEGDAAAPVVVASAEPTQGGLAQTGISPQEQTAISPQENKVHFIEFRSRYAYTYGHSFVIFGRLNEAGEMIAPEVAGLAPKSDDPSVYMLGHVAPVPSSTGWTDGDLEDEYMSANWRVMLTEAEYRKVVAYIRKLQASSPVWHAALYNCNAFVGDIAASMGYQTPFIWLKPQQFITSLRKMNGGPNAIGSTRGVVSTAESTSAAVKYSR
jgi:hypothetical protein